MDFARAVAEVSGFLDQRGYQHALVGGLALALLGAPRTTLDVDWVVERAAQDELVGHLERNGYETLHRSRGYSNHLHKDPERGQVDFIYVDAATAGELFGSARVVEGPGGLPVRVPRPEHLAAMKVHAMKTDPTRTLQEMADIRFLLTLPGVDREEVRERFARAGLEARFREIEATL